MDVINRPEIFGNQLILNDDDEPIGIEDKLLISATDLWISDAVELVRKFGGHVHPAHIDRESNGIVSILGDIPSEYRFQNFEFREKGNISEYVGRFSVVTEYNSLVCSDAHHLWDISEAENCIVIDDEPYSSSLVRQKFFEYLEGVQKI
jgi:hypothetical protein